MRKIYDIGVFNDKLIGSDYEGQTLYSLGTPVYFNAFSGILYTEKASFVIMSYAEDELNSEAETKNVIQEMLEDIWAYA